MLKRRDISSKVSNKSYIFGEQIVCSFWGSHSRDFEESFEL
jgi:hypothetical protein